MNHVELRRRNRRIMAMGSFVVAVVLGTWLTVVGVLSDEVAARINEMSGFLTLFIGGLFGVFTAYMGFGSLENNNAIAMDRSRSGSAVGDNSDSL